MSHNFDSRSVVPLKKAIISQPVTVSPETSVLDGLALLNSSQPTCSLTSHSLEFNQGNTCLIVTKNQQPIGILTHRDIVRLIAQQIQLERLTIGDIMRQPVITLEESQLNSLANTFKVLQNHKIRHLPLVDIDGKLVGLLTHRDIRNALEPTDLLKLRVLEEVMNPTVIQASSKKSLLQLAELMSSASVSCVVLVEEKICDGEVLKIPVGLLTEGDILKFQALGMNLSLDAETVMSTPLFCLHPKDTLLEANWLMQQHQIHHIPIVGNRGELKGIITPTSILRAIKPIDLLQLVEVLQQKINQLEAEKVQLLQTQNIHLEEKVKKRTEALKKANQQLQDEIKNRNLNEAKIAFQASLLEQVRNAIIATDLDGKIIYWNHYAEILYQWTAAEALGNNIINFFVPLDYKNLAEEIVQEVQTRGYWEGEFTTTRKDGSTLPIHIFDTLIQDESGAPIGLVGISFDITECKQAEQQLQQQVQRERLFYQTALNIRQSLNLSHILNNAVVNIRSVLNCDRVLVYQFDNLFNGTIVAESIADGIIPCLGIYLEDTCFKTGGASHYCLGKKTVVNNIETAELTECYKELLSRFQVKANLVVPILIPNQNRDQENVIWGLLIAHQCLAPRNWYPSELELLDEIAVQLSLGIQQSQLYQTVQKELDERQKIEQELRILNQELETRILDRTAKLERQERKSRLFAEIALKIRQSLDIDQILQTTVTEVQKILACDRLLIYRVFSNGTGRAIAESVLPGWRSVLSIDFPEEVFPPEYQQLYRHGTVKAIANIHENYQEVTPCLVEFLQEWNIKAKLIVPILQQDQVWGFMIAHHGSTPRQWTEFEIELMREIADQVGVALEQAQLVERIREREQFIESIADSSPNILYIYDLEENRIIYNSRSLTSILGYTPLEVSEMDDHFFSIFHPDDHETLYQHLQETAEMQDREVSYIEYRIQHKNGEWLWFSSHATVFKRNQQRKAQQILGVAQNISDRKQTELQLRQTNEKLAIANGELARASRLKDEFLANMSHELRTPLNSILGMSEVLQEETFGKLNEQQNQALEMIHRNGKHLLELINDILDLSKIEAGKFDLECDPVSVNELCKQSLIFVKQQAHQKNIRISYQIQDVTESLNVDERRMLQVLINLLNNGVKFTPEGGQVRLEVKGDREQQTVNFSVIDNGIGIAPEDQNRLFQAFFQVDSRLSRPYQGTGLGLVLVKKLVEMHGGTVKVNSQLGKGSCFTVTLPWTSVCLQETPTTPTEGLEPSSFSRITASWLKRPLILLAEDNADNIHTLLNYLQAKGFDVEIARNGIEVVENARSLHPQVILMDISMPEMDGLEATRQIRADSELATLPIIALTALAMPGDRERCLAAGINEYVTKPVQLRQLVQLIQSLIQ